MLLNFSTNNGGQNVHLPVHVRVHGYGHGHGHGRGRGHRQIMLWSSPPTMAYKRCPCPCVPVHAVSMDTDMDRDMDMDVDTGRFLQLNSRIYYIVSNSFFQNMIILNLFPYFRHFKSFSTLCILNLHLLLSTFFAIRHFVPIGLSYFRHYFYSLSIRFWFPFWFCVKEISSEDILDQCETWISYRIRSFFSSKNISFKYLLTVHSTLCPISHFLLSTFFTIRHYVPFGVFLPSF